MDAVQGRFLSILADAVQTRSSQKSYCFALGVALEVFLARLASRFWRAKSRLDGPSFGRRSLIGIGSCTRAIFAISASNSDLLISLNSLFSLSFFCSCKRPMSPNISSIVLAAELFACAGALSFSQISRSVFKANSLSVSMLIFLTVHV